MRSAGAAGAKHTLDFPSVPGVWFVVAVDRDVPHAVVKFFRNHFHRLQRKDRTDAEVGKHNMFVVPNAVYDHVHAVFAAGPLVFGGSLGVDDLLRELEQCISSKPPGLSVHCASSVLASATTGRNAEMSSPDSPRLSPCERLSPWHDEVVGGAGHEEPADFVAEDPFWSAAGATNDMDEEAVDPHDGAGTGSRLGLGAIETELSTFAAYDAAACSAGVPVTMPLAAKPLSQVRRANLVIAAVGIDGAEPLLDNDEENEVAWHNGLLKTVSGVVHGALLQRGLHYQNPWRSWEPAFRAEAWAAATPFFEALENHCDHEWMLEEWVAYHLLAKLSAPFPFSGAGHVGAGEAYAGPRPIHGAATQRIVVRECPAAATADGAAVTLQQLVYGLGLDPAACLYHATTHASAADIVSRGIDVDAGRRNVDFGKGFYLNPDYEDAVDWAYRGKNVREPAIVVYRDVRSDVSAERFPHLILDERSNPSWHSVVHHFRAGSGLGAASLRTFRRFASAEGQQAHVSDLRPRFLSGRRPANQYVVRTSDLAEVWDAEVVAVLCLAPVGVADPDTGTAARPFAGDVGNAAEFPPLK